MSTGKYQAQMLPNARLAGLISKEESEEGQRLVPFVFAEVHLRPERAGAVPRLRSKLPEKHWVFCWDGRRETGYLLVSPRPRDQQEIRFRAEWEMVPKRPGS